MKITMILCRHKDELPYDSRVLREAKALVSAGHRVSIVVVHEKKGIQRFTYEGGVEVIAVPIRDIAVFHQNNIFKNMRPGERRLIGRVKQYLANFLYRRRYFNETLKILLAEKSDAYHCHDFHTLNLGFRASSVRGSILIYDSHEIFTESMAFVRTSARLTKLLYVWCEGRLIKRADHVIAVSEGCAGFLAHRYRIKMPTVIENISEFATDDSTSREEMRNALGMDNKHKVLMYQGLFAPGRGIEVLLEALLFLPQNIILALVGYGPSEPFLRRRVNELRIENRVRFIGKVPREKLLLYSRCADVGVIPIQKRCLSYYYALPNKIFECMAAGVPFAVSNFPDMRRFAIDEDMGVVFDPQNSGDIANAIRFLLNDRNMYERKRANIVKGVELRYNWSVIKRKLLALYEQDKYTEN